MKKKITKEVLDNVDKIMDLKRQAIETFAKMYPALVIEALKRKHCKLLTRNIRMNSRTVTSGAKLVWDNGDEVELPLPMYNMVNDDRTTQTLTSYEHNRLTKSWNQGEGEWCEYGELDLFPHIVSRVDIQ